MIEQWGTLKDTSGFDTWTIITQEFHITFTQPPTVIADVFAAAGDTELEHSLIYDGIETDSFKIYRKQYPTYRGHIWIAIGY